MCNCIENKSVMTQNRLSRIRWNASGLQLAPFSGQLQGTILDEVLPLDPVTGQRRIVTEIKIDFKSAMVLTGAVIVGGTIVSILSGVAKK